MRHRSTAATQDEISGHWWMPEATGRVAGRLVFPIDDAVRLELLGLLDSGEHERTYPVVLGLADDGTPITLADTTWIGGHDMTSALLDLPYRRETLMVGVAYIGAHLATEADRHFTEGFVDLSDLLTWAGPSGLNDRVQSGPLTVAVD